MKEDIKKAAEAIINKKVDWLRKRGERATELGDPVWINKTTAMVPTGADDETHYYKVSIKRNHENCGCKDWKYRGSVNGIPCKHIIRAMAERVIRDRDNETQAILREADEAVKRGELPPHAPEHRVN